MWEVIRSFSEILFVLHNIYIFNNSYLNIPIFFSQMNMYYQNHAITATSSRVLNTFPFYTMFSRRAVQDLKERIGILIFHCLVLAFTGLQECTNIKVCNNVAMPRLGGFILKTNIRYERNNNNNNMAIRKQQYKHTSISPHRPNEQIRKCKSTL